jgi:hypothetical protein
MQQTNDYSKIHSVLLLDTLMDRIGGLQNELLELETLLKELAVRPEADKFSKNVSDHVYYLRTTKNWMQTIGNRALQQRGTLPIKVVFTLVHE